MKNTHRFKIIYFILFCLTCSFTAISAEQVFNPISHYYMNGQLVDSWKLAVGNSTNYHVPIKNGAGQTEDEMLKISTVDYQHKKDAVKAVWQKRTKSSSLILTGNVIDLTNYENLVAIAVDMKIEDKPDNLKMVWRVDCGYPCGGNVDISKNLRKKPINEWFTLPVPLNCFSKEGADLSKVKSPFSISTSNELTMSIANVRLILLPEGEKGCL